ncbi:TPA: glycoside hydrolase family 104 protein [Acinetobacter baumannii]|uniref:glycoside hydrolase family 24 protein n=2 Tax=Gammaproteobacteria TaxID=1236 RepID=UPI0020B8ED78|nr:glycoside hydrolase family 104 protein [Acinetobacter baumannii]UTH20259.1 glycoside hydrolase family 104 protein [Acinetobacter baumannii]UTH23879.1 glycoside hydrolase family 104 protein [Acinetobacter baumannii]
MATRQQLEQALSNPNVRKMLNLIANTEGVKHGYNTLFGNERINDLSNHPNIRKAFTQTDGKKNYTTAAGRYQFIKDTWDGVARQYGLDDFGPRNQDIGAIALIAQNGALDDVLKGNYQGAIRKLGGTWASLPSSTYAQPKKSWAETNRLLGGSTMAKGSMNDLHQLIGGAKITPASSTGRQLRPGFASDIPPELRNTSSSSNIQKASSQKQNLGSMEDLHNLMRVKDLGTQPPIKVSATRQPFDWKAAQQKSMQDQAKKAGPTQMWESALLGASDLGAGLVQGFAYVGDKLGQGLNSALGTNFDTNSYKRFTNQRQDIEDFQQARRQQNGQGFDWARLGGQVAATAPLGALGRSYQGANVLSKAGAGIAAQNAAVGAAIGGAGFAGDANQRLDNAVLGGIGGAAGAALGEKVGQGVSRAVNAVRNTGSQAAQRTAQAIDKNLDDALRQQGMSLGDLSDDVANGLRKEARDALKAGKNLNPEAVARKAVLDRLGLKGTKAQVTGNAIDWQKQAELAKLSGAGDQLRGKLIDDNLQLQNLLNQAAERTGGNATDQFGAMQGAISSLNSQLNQNKQFIGAAYDAARKAAGNDVVIDGRGFANDAFTALDQNYALSSLPASVQKIIKDVADNPDKFTLGKSEELIKILNREYKSSLQMGQPTSSTYSIGLVRDALNKRQAEAMQGLLTSGNDAAQAYQFARQANQFNANQIEGMPLLQDVRKGVEPDKLFNKHILNGNVNELDRTIELLNNVNPQAVNDIKQQVVQFISGKAINQNGQFSPAGMKRALDAIGDRRLATMFSPDELKNLKDIGKAGQYLVTQPPHSYVNNSNTSAALMNYLGGIINRPGVRVLLAPVKDIADNRAVNKALRPDITGAPIPPTPPSPQQQSLIERLVQAGLISGASATTQ